MAQECWAGVDGVGWRALPRHTGKLEGRIHPAACNRQRPGGGAGEACSHGQAQRVTRAHHPPTCPAAPHAASKLHRGHPSWTHGAANTCEGNTAAVTAAAAAALGRRCPASCGARKLLMTMLRALIHGAVAPEQPCHPDLQAMCGGSARCSSAAALWPLVQPPAIRTRSVQCEGRVVVGSASSRIARHGILTRNCPSLCWCWLLCR